MRSRVILSICMLLLFVQSIFAITAKEIMDKADAIKKPKSIKSRTLMKIYKGDRVLEKEFESISRKVKGEDRSLTSFIRPTKIKLLSHTHKKKDSDMWLRLSSGRIKRIAITDKDKTFVNSHFFFEDLDIQSKERNSDNQDSKYLGDKKIMGDDCYMVEVIDKDEKRVYDKLLIYVRKSDYMPIRIDFFYRGEFYKYLELKDIKVIKGYKAPMKVVMYRADGSGRTELVMKKMKYDIKIKKSKFSREALR